MKMTDFLFFFLLLFCCISSVAQKVNDFPIETVPLHVRVEKFDKLIKGNLWNEGTILYYVIYPPAGKDMPGFGMHSDAIDATGEMLVAYTYKYRITGDEADREIANQVFEGILKAEQVTGVPGLVARGFYKTDKPQWFEKLWYDEWHWSTAMEGYRWLGDLSIDKLVSIFHSLGVYYEFCADEKYKAKVEGLLGRFVGKIIEDNFSNTFPFI